MIKKKKQKIISKTQTNNNQTKMTPTKNKLNWRKTKAGYTNFIQTPTSETQFE